MHSELLVAYLWICPPKILNFNVRVSFRKEKVRSIHLPADIEWLRGVFPANFQISIEASYVRLPPAVKVNGGTDIFSNAIFTFWGFWRSGLATYYGHRTLITAKSSLSPSLYKEFLIASRINTSHFDMRHKCRSLSRIKTTSQTCGNFLLRLKAPCPTSGICDTCRTALRTILLWIICGDCKNDPATKTWADSGFSLVLEGQVSLLPSRFCNSALFCPIFWLWMIGRVHVPILTEFSGSFLKKPERGIGPPSADYKSDALPLSYSGVRPL